MTVKSIQILQFIITTNVCICIQLLGMLTATVIVTLAYKQPMFPTVKSLCVNLHLATLGMEKLVSFLSSMLAGFTTNALISSMEVHRGVAQKLIAMDNILLDSGIIAKKHALSTTVLLDMLEVFLTQLAIV